MADLSPAAQAVRDAALATYDKSIPKDDNLWALDRASVIASLRAAADQLTPYSVEDMPGAAFCRNKLLSIATELKAQ